MQLLPSGRLIEQLQPIVHPGTQSLERAIEAAGGVSILAGRIGVSASAPSMWKARKRVPAEYCPAIERETGVRCEDLRPDVAWDVLRLQAVPAPATQEV